MKSIAEQARAKLNLFLHLTGKRPDGYHELLTSVVFPEFGDRLTFSPSDLLTLMVTGEFADDCRGDDNLVLHAAKLLQDYTQTAFGARITLEKNIPVGAGLGGGSADAAAALRGLNRLWKLKLSFLELLELAEQLGADVPMCLHSKPLIASGIGEEIALLDDHEPAESFYFVLVYPRVKLLTAQVFAMLTPEEVERSSFALSHGYDDSFMKQRNDLQRAAVAASPAVGEVLLALETAPMKGLVSRMTGSGSCCFSVFNRKDDAERCAAYMQAQYPHWWVQQTQAYG